MTPAVVLSEASVDARAVTGSPRRRDAIELLVVGGLTLLLLPALWALRALAGMDDAELAVGFSAFWAAYVVNDPHFAVTYLLFYEDVRRRAFGDALAPAQRVRWLVAGFLVPAVLVVWSAFAVATGSAQAVGWMVQLMFVSVGFHYVKQGFGALVILSARRGVLLEPSERRALLGHALAGWAFAWANPSTAGGLFEEKGVVYEAFARPRWFELVSGGALALSTLTLVVVLVKVARRTGRSLPRGPLAVFLVTVWGWTILSNADPLLRYLVPFLHSVQYLYFVWLLRRNRARAEEGPPSFGRPAPVQLGLLAVSALALGWVLFRGAPTFLDGVRSATAPASVRTALGPTPWFALIFAAVNLHHYAMDFVVWRRESPDARWLRA